MSKPIGTVEPPIHDLLAFRERLRVERERMGLSQEAFGNLGGVGKSSQWMYEQGRHWPTMEYMESLRRNNVDVVYLATGQKFDWELLRLVSSFLLRVMRHEGLSFSDEQLFGLFRAEIGAASGVTRPDVIERTDPEPNLDAREGTRIGRRGR